MKEGFDNRIVEYEYIHSIDPKDTAALVNAIDPKDGQIILDGMCGYGSVAKSILEKNKSVAIYLLDESSVQIKRARKNLPLLTSGRFITRKFTYSKLKLEYFDTVVIKMGLHEVSKKDQIAVLKESFRILKPTGKLVIWDIMLDDMTQKLFQKIIKKKDKLAGYNMLVKERYFFREEEFIKNVKRAGFRKINDFHSINYRFSSLKRLESELHNNFIKLNKFNEYIRDIFPKKLRDKMEYKDINPDIQFNIKKKIFKIEK